jgi:hypothetical protein
MTAPISTPVPHSRWLVRDNVDRLAASHAEAARAISELHAAADVHRERSRAIRRVQPPLRQRLAMRRDWPQVTWFCGVLTVTTVFLGWVSVRLVVHETPLPVFAAALPGVLLALATGGAARFATHSIRRHADAGDAGVLLSLFPLAAASVGVATWVSLWLVLTDGIPAWLAVIFALAITLAVAVALMTGSYLGGSPVDDAAPAGDTPVPGRSPRRLRVRHKRARGRLDNHTRQWTTAAHRYAVTVPGPGQPGKILARLLADEAGGLSLDGLDPFDAMILSALRNYHPAVLSADLSLASAKLMPEVNDSPAPR